MPFLQPLPFTKTLRNMHKQSLQFWMRGALRLPALHSYLSGLDVVRVFFPPSQMIL